MTGYYGGEMTYHQGVGVTATVSGTTNTPYFALLSTPPTIAAKPYVALLGFLCIVALALWLFAGRSIAPAYYQIWRTRAQTAGLQAGPLWTLRRDGSLSIQRWRGSRPAQRRTAGPTTSGHNNQNPSQGSDF